MCLCPWQGGVVGITIDWECDLDWHVRHCKPIYQFHGLYGEKNLSPGFNFRYLTVSCLFLECHRSTNVARGDQRTLDGIHPV